MQAPCQPGPASLVQPAVRCHAGSNVMMSQQQQGTDRLVSRSAVARKASSTASARACHRAPSASSSSSSRAGQPEDAPQGVEGASAQHHLHNVPGVLVLRLVVHGVVWPLRTKVERCVSGRGSIQLQVKTSRSDGPAGAVQHQQLEGPDWGCWGGLTAVPHACAPLSPTCKLFSQR